MRPLTIFYGIGKGGITTCVYSTHIVTRVIERRMVRATFLIARKTLEIPKGIFCHLGSVSNSALAPTREMIGSLVRICIGFTSVLSASFPAIRHES